MKFNLSFQLPVDSKNLNDALNGVSMRNVINSFDKFLLFNLQSNTISERDKLVYGSIRKEFHLSINEQRANLIECTKE